MRYTFQVVETVQRDMLYEVEAESMEQARSKAEAGEMVRNERFPIAPIVLSREIVG